MNNVNAKWLLTINFDEDSLEDGVIPKWTHNYDPDLDRLLLGKLGLQEEIWKGTKNIWGSGPEDCHDAVKEHLENFYTQSVIQAQEQADLDH